MTQLSSVTIGVVVAAGSGSRLGAGIPKAFVQVRGVSMVQRAIGTLGASGVVSGLIVVVPPDWREDGLEAMCVPEQGGALSEIRVIRGGATRQQSVSRALSYCKATFGSAEFIIIHDAARCLTPPAVFRSVAEAAWVFGAATAAVPVVDTLRRVEAKQKTICGELDREGVWHIQTPQAFRIDLLHRAHEAAREEATDDTSLVTPLHPVQIVPGSRLSFKITTPEDLVFAELLSEN